VPSSKTGRPRIQIGTERVRIAPKLSAWPQSACVPSTRVERTDISLCGLKRANPANFPADTKDLLNDISKSCLACQVYSSKPIHFQIRDPAEIVFNHEIQLDLMYLHGKPVFHIVDVATTFSAANFLSAQDVSSVLNTILTGWATLYIGFPECILAYQVSVSMATHWNTACDLSTIHLRHTGIEIHNSIGSGERFHSPLRRIFENKIAGVSEDTRTRATCIERQGNE
jgi:hypothetical protein